MSKQGLQGKLVVLEGADACGKGTQVRLLEARIKSLGVPVRVYDFPRYERFFGQEIARLLGSKVLFDQDPFLMALAYANDRLEASVQMRADLDAGLFVLCNRYVASNLAHGAAKYGTWDMSLEFIRKVGYMEYVINNLPRPDLQFFLDVPSEKTRTMMTTKGERAYLVGLKIDEAEGNIDHQERAMLFYRWLSENNGLTRLDCLSEGGDLRSKEEINEMLWEVISQRFGV